MPIIDPLTYVFSAGKQIVSCNAERLSEFVKDWNYENVPTCTGFIRIKLISKKENKTMTMSRDRVRFFLDSRYFKQDITKSGMGRKICRGILQRAFGISCGWSDGLMRQYPDGFHIVCRPSQFARFIVFRHEEGNCTNGIRDLNPEIIKAKPDALTRIASVTEVSRHNVLKVISAFGYDIDEYRERGGADETEEVDVSKNPAQHES